MKAINLGTLLVHNTPVETYSVQGVPVYVKRDDLCTTDLALPGMAKLRALLPILLDIKAKGPVTVAVYATRVSRIGWATAMLCQYLDLKCHVYYPTFLGQCNRPMLGLLLAKQAGAELTTLNVRDSCVSHYHEAADMAADAGECMLPYGLVSALAVQAYEQEAATIPQQYVAEGTVVSCMGSGVTLTGVWMAMPASTKVIGVQMGQEPQLRAGSVNGKPPIQVVTSQRAYYNMCSTPVPFTCDKYYDAKAWEWLTEHIKELKQPVLFYNMG